MIGGAFGAHALRHLPPERLNVLKTAMHYQLVHAIALLMLVALSDVTAGKALRTSAFCFTAGTVIFSGSLLTVSVAGVSWAGAITPLGGTALIAGWLSLAFARLRASA